MNKEHTMKREAARTAMINFIRKYGKDNFDRLCSMMERGVSDKEIGETFGFTHQNANHLKKTFGVVVVTIEFYILPEDAAYDA